MRCPGNGSVRAYGNLDALLGQPPQVSALDGEELLGFGIVLGVCLNFLKLRGGHTVAEPAPVRPHTAIRKVRVHNEIRLGLNQFDVLIIDVLVPYAVREIVQACPEHCLRIFQRKDMSDRPQAFLVGLVDTGAI